MVYIATILTFGVLIFLVAYILINGIPYLKPSLFSLTYTSENVSLVPAAVNTLIMTVLSLAIAIPFGIFTAVYLVEYAKRGNRFVELIRLTAETLSGIPSIVYGLFGLFVLRNLFGMGVFPDCRGRDFVHYDFTFDHATT